ncbi:YdgA family protein [Spongorhabdus nitratireducens]
MKKMIIGLSAAAIAAGVLVGPKVIGDSVESRLAAEISRANNYPGLTVELEDFQKGWFASSAVVKVDFIPPLSKEEAGDFKGIKFQTALEIAHGPFTFQHGLGLNRFSWESHIINTPELEQKLAISEPVYRSEGQVSWFGNISFNEVVPAFEVTEGDVTLQFSGYQSKAWTGSDGFINYDGDIAQIEIGDSDKVVKLDNLDLTLSAELSMDKLMSYELYDGEFQISVGQLADGEVFNVSDITMVTDIDVSPDASKADMQIRYGVGKVEVDEFQVSELGFDISLLNYSSAFNKAYNQTFAKLLDGEPLAEEVINQIALDSLPLLLETKPEFKIDSLRFTLPEGKYDSNMSLKLSDYSLNPELLNDESYWLKKLQLSASSSADKALAKKLAEMVIAEKVKSSGNFTEAEIHKISEQQAEIVLASLTAQGILVHNEQQYTAEFSMEEGKAVLNGNPVPLPAI